MSVSPSGEEGFRGGMMAIDGGREREIRLKEMTDWIKRNRELVIGKSQFPQEWLKMVRETRAGDVYDALVYAARMK